MRVNSMYTPINNNTNMFAKDNVKVGGSKKETKARDDKKAEDGNNNIIKANSNTKDDLIKNLKKQIESINKNEKFDEDTKKVKIETIMKQIEEIEELDRKQKQEEMANKLKGDDRTEAEKAAAQKAKERKKEIEDQAKGTDVDVSISEEGLTNLILADQKIHMAEDMQALKAEKIREAYHAKRARDFDAEFQATSGANTLSYSETERIHDKVEREVNAEFEKGAPIDASERLTKLKEMLESDEFGDDPGTLTAIKEEMNKINEDIAHYNKRYENGKAASRKEIDKKYSDIINSREFTEQFDVDTATKDELLEKLNGIISKIDEVISKTVGNANNAVDKAEEAEAKDTDKQVQQTHKEQEVEVQIEADVEVESPDIVTQTPVE